MRLLILSLNIVESLDIMESSAIETHWVIIALVTLYNALLVN